MTNRTRREEAQHFSLFFSLNNLLVSYVFLRKNLILFDIQQVVFKVKF